MKVEGSVLRVEGFVLRVEVASIQGFGFWVVGLGMRVSGPDMTRARVCSLNR